MVLTRLRAWLRDSLPRIIIVDNACLQGLRTARKASGKNLSYSHLIDAAFNAAFDRLPHRERTRALKQAKANGANVNPHRLRVE